MITTLKISRYLIPGILFLFCAYRAMTQPPIAVPDGYTAGVTGGGNATPVQVSIMTDNVCDTGYILDMSGLSDKQCEI